MPDATLAPAAPTNFNIAYGGIPQVPSPTATGGAAITGDIQNLAQLYNLSGNVNAFNIGQARAPLIAGLPNYENMLAASSGNITSLLKGEIPEDVRQAMYQAGAERGLATGAPGAPNANAALMRALGLTSLDLTGRGEQELTSAIARTPTPPLFNLSAFLTTPEQMQEAQTAANIYGSAPSPEQAAYAAMGAARAGTRLAGGYPTLGTGSRVSGMSPITQIPNLGANLGGPASVAMGATSPTNTWASRTGSEIGTYSSPWAGGGTAFTGEKIEPTSAAWQQLKALDPLADPSGWTRSDLAAVLGVAPEDLDLGAPAGGGGYFYAGANPALPGGGTFEDYFGDLGP